jgi:hypothetical protein
VVGKEIETREKTALLFLPNYELRRSKAKKELESYSHRRSAFAELMLDAEKNKEIINLTNKLTEKLLNYLINQSVNQLTK